MPISAPSRICWSARTMRCWPRSNCRNCRLNCRACGRTAQAAEATAEGVRAALRNGASIDALPKVLESPLIQRLREREVQLKADIADLSTTLLDNHPRIRALSSQLADLEGQIRGEAQNVLRSLTTEAETALARESQLVADLNRLKAESARAGEDEVELRALEREAAAQARIARTHISPAIAKHRRAATATICRPMPAYSRARPCRPSPISPRYCRSSARRSSARC